MDYCTICKAKHFDVGRCGQPALSRAELIEAIKAHAIANYENPKLGWDYVIEAWDDAHIDETIGKAQTLAGAIKAITPIIRVLREREGY